MLLFSNSKQPHRQFIALINRKSLLRSSAPHPKDKLYVSSAFCFYFLECYMLSKCSDHEDRLKFIICTVRQFLKYIRLKLDAIAIFEQKFTVPTISRVSIYRLFQVLFFLLKFDFFCCFHVSS